MTELPERWVALSCAAECAWVVTSDLVAIEDAVSAYIGGGKLRDSLLTVTRVVGSRLTIPVSSVKFWDECTQESYRNTEELARRCDVIDREVRQAILGYDDEAAA